LVSVVEDIYGRFIELKRNIDTKRSRISSKEDSKPNT